MSLPQRATPVVSTAAPCGSNPSSWASPVPARCDSRTTLAASSAREGVKTEGRTTLRPWGKEGRGHRSEHQELVQKPRAVCHMHSRSCSHGKRAGRGPALHLDDHLEHRSRPVGQPVLHQQLQGAKQGRHTKRCVIQCHEGRLHGAPAQCHQHRPGSQAQRQLTRGKLRTRGSGSASKASW